MTVVTGVDEGLGHGLRPSRWLTGLAAMVAGELLSGWVVGHMLESFGLLALLIGVIMVARAPALARLRSLHPSRHATLRHPAHPEAAPPPDGGRRPSRLQRSDRWG